MTELRILRTLELLRDADAVARRRAAAALVERLGGGAWRAEEPELDEDSLSVVHRPTAIDFLAVPGGSFEMGLTDEDIEEASEHIDWVSYVAKWISALSERARPVHAVRVRPFLVARTPLTRAQAERLGASGAGEPAFTREGAWRFARACGFRLPSEAEFEWLARDGGGFSFLLDAARRSPKGRDFDLRSRFGARELTSAHWMEDDWHPDYNGAPAVSAPWRNGGVQGVRRAGFALDEMQDAQELLDALAAARCEGGPAPCAARFAMDLDLTVEPN